MNHEITESRLQILQGIEASTQLGARHAQRANEQGLEGVALVGYPRLSAREEGASHA